MPEYRVLQLRDSNKTVITLTNDAPLVIRSDNILSPPPPPPMLPQMLPLHYKPYCIILTFVPESMIHSQFKIFYKSFQLYKADYDRIVKNYLELFNAFIDVAHDGLEAEEEEEGKVDQDQDLDSNNPIYG